MLLSGVLIALFLAGCWLYCLTEAVITPASAYLGWPKRVWITIIASTFIVGAIAWLIARRSWSTGWWTVSGLSRLDATPAVRYSNWASPTAAKAALARHPSSRARREERGDWAETPKGPDDDPEFLRRLNREIRGE
jgi:hypothetical protein